MGYNRVLSDFKLLSNSLYGRDFPTFNSFIAALFRKIYLAVDIIRSVVMDRSFAEFSLNCFALKKRFGKKNNGMLMFTFLRRIT
jgi:hypothetical protein